MRPYVAGSFSTLTASATSLSPGSECSITPALVAVAHDDVVVDRLDDLRAVGFEVGLRVVLQLGLHLLELVLQLGEAVVLGGLFQRLERPPGVRFVGGPSCLS